MISIIVPTIQGREESLDRCLAAYEATTDTDHEIIVVRDEPTWPHACNLGYEQSVGDIVHFTADDLEPLPGWWHEAVDLILATDELPAPRVMNHHPDGVFDNQGDGPDGALTHFTRIPILRRDQYDRIGRWPEANYVADVWLSEKARTLGIPTRMVYSYAFVHHWAQEGRVDGPETMAVAAAILAELRTGL